MYVSYQKILLGGFHHLKVFFSFLFIVNEICTYIYTYVGMDIVTIDDFAEQYFLNVICIEMSQWDYLLLINVNSEYVNFIALVKDWGQT